MAISESATDILRALPADTILYDDTNQYIRVKVPRDSTIESTTIARWTGIVVDFRTQLITIQTSSDSVSSPRDPVDNSPRKSGLKPQTESERTAAAMADSMGCIDCDNLVPSYELQSTHASTQLLIGRLLQVNDDALRDHLPVQATHYVYNMKKRVTIVHFSSDRKRKAE